MTAQPFEATADPALATIGTLTAAQSTTMWGPLLPFPTWNQSGTIKSSSSVNYNDYCPIDPATGSRSLTGCVATAMAEILYYWHAPLSIAFTAADAYTSNAGSASQVDIDADAAKYGFASFSSLSSGLSSLQYDGDPAEMALLAFGLGIKCHADYSSNETWASWSTDTFKDLGFSSATWSDDWNAAKPAVIANIQAGEPVYLNVPGHLAVIDGYNSRTDTFHIALGWGGFDDGWYTLPGVGDFPGSSTPETAIYLCYNLRIPNRAPTGIDISSSAVAANQPAGTEVGVFRTTDPDPVGNFTYSLVGGTGSSDNASFTIDGNRLLTAASLGLGGKSSCSIRVRATDQGGLSIERVFTISVTNVNGTPTGISLSTRSVAENQAIGTAVGTFSTSDPDAGNTFTYSLVSGTGDTDNSHFTIADNQLLTADTFNYEAQNSYSIRIRTTDQGGLWLENVFTIRVNRAPTDMALNNASVAENQAAGTVVGTLSTSDPDAGDTFIYSLASGTGAGDDSNFMIAGNQLKTAVSFDYEARNAYSIRIRVTDQGGLSYEKAFTISVNNVGEPIGVFGMVADQTKIANKTFTNTAADGDVVTYKLTGGGIGTLRDDGSLSLVGTTVWSALSISVRKGKNRGDGYSTLSQITSDGPLKSISAPKAFIAGDVQINGRNGSTAGTLPITITLAGMTDGKLNTHGEPIGSLKLQSWLDSDATADELIAPWIGSISVSRDWQADILTSSSNKGVAIGKLNVGGNLTNATLWSAGIFQGLAVKGAISGSRIAASGDITSISAAELLDSEVLVGVAQSFAGSFAVAKSDLANQTAKLGKLTISGRKLPRGQVYPAYVNNSQISAGSYGTVVLTNVASAQTLLHVAADTGTLQIKSTGGGMLEGGTWKGGATQGPGKPQRPNLVQQLI